MLSEATIIDLITSTVAVDECERNLDALVEEPALSALQENLHALIERSVTVVDAPQPSAYGELSGRADPKDVPHLASALEQKCSLLVTRNLKDYDPGHPDVDIVSPGDLVRRIRDQLREIA